MHARKVYHDIKSCIEKFKMKLRIGILKELQEQEDNWVCPICLIGKKNST